MTVQTPKRLPFEIAAIDIFDPFSTKKHRFVLCYRPPSMSSNDDNIQLINLLIDLGSVPYPTSFLGDFNYPNINWASKTASQNPDNHFLEFSSDLNLQQLIKSPTRKTHILDLILTNSPEFFQEFKILPPFGPENHKSDHNFIESTFKFSSKNTQEFPTKAFFKANYEQINNILLSIDWNTIFYGSTNINQLYNVFLSTIHQIIDEFVPITIPKPLISKYPSHIQKLISYQQKLWEDTIHEKVYDKFLKTTKKLDREICKYQRNRESKNLITLKSRYSLASSILKNKSQSIPTITHNGVPIFNNAQKTEIIADFFQSIYTTENQHTDHNHIILPSKPLHSISTSQTEVFETLKSLTSKNNISPDGIPEIFLKNCAEGLTYPIYYIISYIFMTGSLPNIWKNSIIVPIPKIPNSPNPNDYRPISLLCPISKVFEKMVYKTITFYLEIMHLLPENQHGFQKFKSVTTNLLETFDDLSQAIENKQVADIIYFDFSKAFDTVPHKQLLEKLREIGIVGSFHKLLTNYLSDRTFSVKIYNNFSSSRPITSGVPQGSVLGPLLFSIYISDLHQKCFELSISTKLFADDLKAYTISPPNSNFHLPLQHFINKLETYAFEKGLKLSASKCKVLHVGNKNPNHEYFLHQSKINPITGDEPVRDLGVYFTQNLKFNSHIQITSSKAYRVLFSLIKSIKSKNPEILLHLYKTYVLPILDFSTPVYNPYLQKDIDQMEKVQKAMLRIIFNRSNPRQETPDYTELLKIYKIDSLQTRRLKTDLKFFNKTLYGLTRVKHNISTKQTKTRGQTFKFIVPISKNLIRKNSFFARIPSQYSKLPDHIRSNQPKIFNKLLESHDISSILHPTYHNPNAYSP